MSSTRKRKRLDSSDNNNNNNINDSNNNNSNNSLISTTTSTIPPSRFPTYAQKNNGEGFSERDYNFLCENESFRYMDNSKSGKIGHAVIVKDKDGNKVALQYAIPYGDGQKIPKVCQLNNIEEINRFGMTRYKATTLDNTPMYAKRYVHAKINYGNNQEDEVDIAYFSPSEKEGREPFWGSEKKIPLFNEKLSKKKTKELKKELNELKTVTKCGNDLVIDHEAVRIRDENKTRTPDQNTVMGESACQAYAGFLDTMVDELSLEMRKIFKRSIDAPLRNAFYSNYRPEWLHAEGFSLTPMTKNPQRKDNLGAAPKWTNTEMMVLERIAKWFALNRPESYVKIKPTFEMLLDSELIKNIKFEVTVEEKGKFVKFLQDIDPLIEYPLFRKPSDLAQGTAITHKVLQGVAPISRSPIVNHRSNLNTTTTTTTTTTSTLSSLAAEVTNVQPSLSSSTLPQPARAQGLFSAPLSASPVGKKEKLKQEFPTHLKYEKSIVQITTTYHTPNYNEPWLGTNIDHCSGTGLVIEHNDRKYILTNAHCVQNSVVVRVRLANERTRRYEATRVCVSYQCDLALLEVSNEEFNQRAQPVELGEMVDLLDKVQTVGFPMGGNEISISKGIVSRIEVQEYSLSGLEMLQVQVDAAVNSGNSGGPVFSNEKVVGVAFQGYGLQGLGYMIPAPIIHHFLKEALSERVYKGFPILPITLQELNNPYLRKYYGMTEKQTGVRISRVDNLCDAHSKLKPNDILLEIDSLPISNDGAVDIPGVGKCIDILHVYHTKFVGDSVDLKVLRKGPFEEIEIHNITVQLDRVPLETQKIPELEHDKMPTFYIASGICFIPLSRSYIYNGDKGSDFESYQSIETNCSLLEMSKKEYNEQIVIVSNVLDCEEALGYSIYENAIIKQINGQDILNIRDVIMAIENNKDDMHYIMTVSNEVIAIKNMSQLEHSELLKRYHIHKDRSEDLLFSSPKPTVLNTVDLLLSRPKANVLNVIDNDSSSRINKPYSKNNNDNNNTKLTSSLEIVSSKPKQKDLGVPGMMPGQKKYLATLNELEEKYKDYPADEEIDIDEEELNNYSTAETESISSDDEDEADNLSISLGEESDEIDEDEQKESSEDEKKKRKVSFAGTQSLRLFQNKKPPHQDDSEEALHHQKRKAM